jgi:glucosamine-6-phosphate deaminase
MSQREISKFTVDKLEIEVYPDRRAMGDAAATVVSELMRRIVAKKGRVTMAFAAAPSQNEFLERLCQIEGVDWAKVIAFQLDEYIGLPEHSPQSFGQFLKEHIFNKVNVGKVILLNGNASDPEVECERYSALLKSNSIDIACIGIGENGHIAFNDPPVADFADPKLVKIVELDHRCRVQQVNDGCFESLDDVPTEALTMTIPAVIGARWIVCIVPGSTKSDAVKNAIEGEISTACPASILRQHPRVMLFVDGEAARKLRLTDKS